MSAHPTPEAPSDGLIGNSHTKLHATPYSASDLEGLAELLDQNIRTGHDIPACLNGNTLSRLIAQCYRDLQAAARIQVLEGELEAARINGEYEQGQCVAAEARAQALQAENGRMREALTVAVHRLDFIAQVVSETADRGGLAESAKSAAKDTRSALTGETGT